MMIRISIIYTFEQYADLPVANKMILFKKQLFDLEVKGQGPTKVMTVRDTPPYGHAPTYQISLTYLWFLKVDIISGALRNLQNLKKVSK
jgi:hypothetical protein